MQVFDFCRFIVCDKCSYMIRSCLREVVSAPCQSCGQYCQRLKHVQLVLSVCSESEFGMDMYKKDMLFSMVHTHSCFSYFLNNMHLAFSPSAVILHLPEPDFFLSSACWVLFQQLIPFSILLLFLPPCNSSRNCSGSNMLARSYYNCDSSHTVICLFILHL